MFEFLTPPSPSTVWLWLVLILGLAAWSDVLTRKIPNRLVLSGFIVLLALQLHTQNLQPLSLLIGLIVGLSLWQLKLIGGGDSKLLILVSAAFAPVQLPLVYLCISLCGAAQAWWYQHVKKTASLPYAVAIFIGVITFFGLNLF